MVKHTPRKYFTSQQAAEQSLINEGYQPCNGAWSWCKNHTFANVRYNGRGYFILTLTVPRDDR